MKLLSLAFILIIFAPSPIFAGKAPKKVIYLLQLKDNSINLHAENVSFMTILQDLEKRSGIKVVIHEGVDDKEVSLKVKALPTYALSSLMEKMELENFVVLYDKELHSTIIHVLPPGQNINERMGGKTIVRAAHFRDGKDATRIKGKEILTKPQDAQERPIRYVKGEILLKFHLGVLQKEADTLSKKHNLAINQSEVLSKIGYVKAEIPEGSDVLGVIKELTKDHKIKAAEPNYISNIMASTDPLYQYQWYVGETNFDKAWDKIINKNKIRIAVIDTGVDKEHPDLQGSILDGFDFVNNTPEVVDNHGHGTFVAGIIASQSNGIGIKGLFDAAEIIPVKALNDHGIGTYEDIARAIIYSVDQGAKVINLSMGGYAYSSMLQHAVDYALENGCIVVAAGGNDGLNRKVYPAAYPDVIGVAALGKDGKILPLSNSGRHIAVSAPGEDIISTGLNGQYAYASGTSAATPMVSALAALLSSEQPDLSSSLIHKLILRSAKDLGVKGKDSVYGKGKIDAETALGKTVKPFHDVAVRTVHVEPLKIEKGKPAFIIACIINAGTYKEERCDIVLYEIVGEKKKEIGRKKGVVVLDKLQLSFDWKPEGSKDSFQFEVSVITEINSTLSNNSKATNHFTVKQEEEVHILYETTPPAHQWIGLQAYNKLPDSDLKKEIGMRLPTNSGSPYYYKTFIPDAWWEEKSDAPANDMNALIEGMWEEDEGTLLITTLF